MTELDDQFTTEWATDHPVPPPPPEPKPAQPPAPQPAQQGGDFRSDWAADQTGPPAAVAQGPATARAAALTTSLRTGVRSNPDQAAKADQLAQQSGLPPDVAARNPEQAQQAARLAQLNPDQLLHEHPAIAQWLSDPQNAAIAHDDVDNLRHVDFAARLVAAQAVPTRTSSMLEGGVPTEPTDPLPILSGVIGRGVRQGAYGLGSTLSAPFAVVQQAYRWLTNDTSTPSGWSPLGSIYNAHDVMAAEERARATYAPSFVRDVATGVTAMAGDPTNVVLPVAGGEMAAAKLAARGLAGAYQARQGARMVPTMVPSVARALASLRGAAAVQGEQAAGQALQGTLEQRQAGGLGGPIVPNATDVANAATQAAWNYAIGRAAGLVGPLTALRDAPPTLGQIPGHIGASAVTMGTQQAGGVALQGMVTGQPTTPGELAQAYITGALPGALFGAAAIPGALALGRAQAALRQTHMAERAAVQARALAALGTAVDASAVAKRSPDRLEDLISKMSAATGLPNTGKVLFQAQDWDEYWQPHGEQAAEDMANALTGDPEAYAKAKASGGDIAIPVERYAARISGTQHFEPLLDRARLSSDPESMTLRQADTFMKSAPKVLQDIGAQVKAAAMEPGERHPGTDLIRDEIVEQMVSSGVAAGDARAVAAIHQSFWQTMAAHFSAAGQSISADELAQKFPLAITRQVPEVMQGTPIEEMDAALNRMRSGQPIALQEQIFGPSLHEFIRSKGGVQDTGGELKELVGTPFKKNVVQPKEKGGMSPDLMAMAAEEAGYTKARPGVRGDTNALIDAIRGEDAGNKVYSTKHFNEGAHQAAQAESEMAHYLRAIGAHPETGLSNEEIKSRIAEERQKEPFVYKGARVVTADVPYAGGTSRDGTVVYIDRHIPRYAEVDGKRVDLHAMIADHELTEHRQMQEGKSYAEAHLTAEHAEDKAVDHQGVSHADYEKLLKPYITQAREGFDRSRVPVDLNEQPYRDMKEEKLLEGRSGASASMLRTFEQATTIQPRSDSLAFPELLKEWQKAHGDRTPVPGSEAWDSLVRQSREIDRQKGRLFQAEPTGPKKVVRGFLTREGMKHTITFTPDANWSTFLHESGHRFFLVLEHLAGLDNAPQGIRDDYAAILKWLKIDNVGQMTDAHHEQVAEALENYFAKGVAPSVELRGVFAKFKAWMKLTYNRLIPYPGVLSDQVHGIFDRLFAGDAEIQEARKRAGDDQLLPREAFPSDEDHAKYLAAAGTTVEREESRLREQLMRAYSQEYEAKYQSEKARVRSEVAEGINALPVYQAIRALQDGKLPSGEMLPDDLQGLKIRRKDLEDRYPGMLDQLPGPRAKDEQGNVVDKPNAGRYIYAKNGIPLDDVAEHFGYQSADQFVKELSGAPDRRQRIEQETEARMNERHPDALLDGSIADRADQALAGPEKGNLLVREVNALAAKSGQAATPREIVRMMAQKEVAGMTVQAIRPDLYRANAARASKRAFEAAAKGDYQGAFLAKQQELLSHELHTAALKGVKDAEAVRDHVAELGTPAARARIGKAGGWEWTLTNPLGGTERFDSEEEAASRAKALVGATYERTSSYLDQIDGIRSQYEFAKVSDKTLKRRENLRTWVDTQREDHLPVNIPDSVLAATGRLNWRQMTVDHLRDIGDAVDSIEHAAMVKNKLLAAADERNLSAVAEGVNAEIRTANAPVGGTEVAKRPRDLGGTMTTLTKPLGRAAFALTRVLDAIWRMAGYRDGGKLYDAWERPLLHGREGKAEDTANAVHAWDEAMEGIWHKGGGAGVKNWQLHKQTFIPAIGRGLTKLNAIAFALHWGSDGNRQRLLETGIDPGRPLTQEGAQAIIDTLDDRDRRFCNWIWKHEGSYRSRAFALEERTKGFAPTAVAGLPFSGKAGDFDGGYHHIMYDTVAFPNLKMTEEKLRDLMMSGQGPAGRYTSHGHLKERTGNMGVPLSLAFDDIFAHEAQVIHDLNLREPLIDANRLLKRIGPTMTERYGPNMQPLFVKQLEAIAGGGIRVAEGFERLVGWMRQGYNASFRSFNVANFGQQLLGLPFILPHVGPVNFFKGLSYAINPVTHLAADHLCPTLRYRNIERGRILNEKFSQLSPFAPFNRVASVAYSLVNVAWKVLDCHAFYASKFKADAEFPHDEAKCIDIAASKIAQLQGAVDAPDMSPIMRGNEYSKLITNNMSFANAQLNLLAYSVLRYCDKGGHLWNPAGSPKLATRMAADMVGYLVVAPMIYMIGRQWMTQSKTDLDDPKKLAKDAAGEMGYTILSSLPVGRDIAPNVFEDKAQWEGPAGGQWEGTLARVAMELAHAGEERRHGHQGPGLPAGEKAALDLAGILWHFPSAQIEHAIAGYQAAEAQHMNPILPTLMGAPVRPKKER